MKSILTIFILLFNLSLIIAQNNEPLNDVGRIVLNTYLPVQLDIPTEAKEFLKTKLNQITSANGVGGNNINPRFIITANVNVGTKDIIAGPPQMIAQNIDVTFFIGDAITNTIFSNTTLCVKGVGKNENKAFIEALKRINPRHKDIQLFLEEGKDKIVDYYSSNCSFILKNIETLTAQKKYDEALFEANMVPIVCEECYNRVMEFSIEVYRTKANNECAQNIAKCKSLIVQNEYDNAAAFLSGILPDVLCYNEAQEINNHRCAAAIAEAKGAWSIGDYNSAGKWLGKIPADSKCYNEAITLGEEIKSKLKADEDREWEFKLQEQQDETNIEIQRINAIKEIGVAFGNNQPQTVTYNKIYWK